LIVAVQKDEILQQDVLRADPGDGLLIWWLGQSGFIVKGGQGTVVFDPYLSDSLTHKYQHTTTPHVRMTERAIDPQYLQGIDIVTSSHNHTDHLDRETLCPLIAANPEIVMVIPDVNRSFVARRLGCDPPWLVGLKAGTSHEVRGIRFDAVPAQHHETGLPTDDCLGYVVTFATMRVYHSGDTLRYPQMATWLRPFQVDLAILPINGRRAERRVAGNLWGAEAAQLARDIQARLVVPCHYDMFAFNTETPDAFVAACERLQQPYKVLQCGERWALEPV
jgi:L-ascorbate metabolism protein UlaG (beta-lactamase superfamily)